jgi:hypothetical protein
MMVVIKQSACFSNIKIKGNEELLVILNRTVLHNQTGRWTVT